jgi:hypothetical protein
LVNTARAFFDQIYPSNPHRLCEERSDAAIQSHKHRLSYGTLDCRALATQALAQRVARSDVAGDVIQQDQKLPPMGLPATEKAAKPGGLLRVMLQLRSVADFIQESIDLFAQGIALA